MSPGAAAVWSGEGHGLTSAEAEPGPTCVAIAKDESPYKPVFITCLGEAGETMGNPLQKCLENADLLKWFLPQSLGLLFVERRVWAAG